MTFGCQMNIHESEKLAGFLEERGYTETKDQKQADIIVFNTCCIRKAAEEKILGNIGAIKPLKKKNPNMLVAVCGCMSQQQDKADYIHKTFPFVDIIFGTHNLSKFGAFLDDYELNHRRILSIEDSIETLDENVPMFRTSGYNGWVNIMYGCNNFCTYCIVPYVRGREVSRKADDIIEEVEILLKSGKYKVITLLGQNVNSYGKDLKDGMTFAKLMEKIAQLPYDFKLKFMTSHPKDLTDDVIEVIAKYPKIAKAIHLPVQSGSDRILKLMNRNYTVDKYKNTISKIRENIPDVSITSDFIVGFPTESDEDFDKTCQLVMDIEYNGIFAFMYSPRNGTPAAEMQGQITQEVKNERVNKLLNLEKQISKRISQNMIGKVYNCIIESEIASSKETKQFLAKTDGGKTIIVESNELKPLEFVDIRIDRIEDNQLYGSIYTGGKI